jgi:16S rRNA processing protein RimM
VTAGSSGGSEADWPEDAVEVGRIVDAWGVKGWIKVQPFAADPQALFSSRRWFLRPPQDPGPRGLAAALPSPLRIMHAKSHGDVVVAQVQEIGDRTAAESLRGSRVFVPRTSFPTAGDDEYYWVDLIGLTVFNRQGERLGRVAGLIDTGPHSVLRVVPDAVPAGRPPEEAERLIPFVAAYVDEVSLAERRITVDWGLDF